MIQGEGQEDRRRHRRASIRICSEFGDPGAPTRIETVDFSVGGFACVLDHPVKTLTKLGLQFEFPPFGDAPSRTIDCEAIVVRCEKTRQGDPSWMVGAAFCTLAEDARKHIERFLAWSEWVGGSAADQADCLPEASEGSAR